jgi:Protein of unknown function (DUF3455)
MAAASRKLYQKEILPMSYQSKGTLLGAVLLAAFFLIATMLLSTVQLFAQVSQVPQVPPIPSVITVPDQVATAIYHAEGAQIYQCEPDSHRRLIWQPREPIATLILDGDTVGRHYAALRWGHVDVTKLRWEHVDGSAVQAKIVARAPGANPDDLPLLKFDVVSQTEGGALYGVTAIQRINTRGGMAEGSCDTADSYLSVPFTADYVFWRAD